MKKIILFCSLSIILFISCNKEEIQKERLYGKWIYEKAELRKNPFRKIDILDTYRYLDVYFTVQGAIKFEDVKDSVILIGTYYLNKETEIIYTDAEGNEIPISQTQMLLNYSDTSTGLHYEELWENLSIRKSKISYSTEIDGKKAFFRLRRQ